MDQLTNNGIDRPTNTGVDRPTNNCYGSTGITDTDHSGSNHQEEKLHNDAHRSH